MGNGPAIGLLGVHSTDFSNGDLVSAAIIDADTLPTDQLRAVTQAGHEADALLGDRLEEAEREYLDAVAAKNPQLTR